MAEPKIMVITGSRKGIGRYLAEHYLKQNYEIYGCSRGESDLEHDHYHHYRLDVADEKSVKEMFVGLRKDRGRLDVLINNAGIASMNHAMLTPMSTVEKILSTNVIGTFLFCRESARLMRKTGSGRIINFGTVATPLNLEGEAIYAASKAAVVNLTKVLAREFADLGITVNAVGPTPIDTDLTRGLPQAKMDALIQRQAIHRIGEFEDISNVIDFYIKPESNFITGQVMYLGGV